MSIAKRKNGSYTVRIDQDRKNGKRNKVNIGTFDTKKEAERAERDAKQNKDRGIDLNPERIDVGTLLDRYLANRANLGRGAKTLERYTDIVRLYLKPHIGSIPLSKLKPAQVNQLITIILPERGGADGGPLSAQFGEARISTFERCAQVGDKLGVRGAKRSRSRGTAYNPAWDRCCSLRGRGERYPCGG
jgi:hypothetical protein